MKKITLFIVAGLLSAAGALAQQKPNVVLIMADDLGTGDVGCYGSQKIKTPNIDRLAEQGMRFTDAHAAAAVCTPSRYAMLSGRYYWGPWNGELLMRDEWTLLPEVLRDNGYATAYFGKWHLGWGDDFEGRVHRSDIDWNLPLPAGVRECGFDFYFGTPFSHNESPSVFVLNRQVLDIDPDDPISIIGPKEPGGAPYGKSIGGKAAHKARPEHRIDLMVTHQAKKWIQQNSAGPFFMNIAFVAPHVPLSPGQEFQGKSDLGVYGDFVQQLDGCVGQIFQTLEECGVADNTIIMFTSDNGAVMHREAIRLGHRSNLDWLGQKTDAWEGGVRVPFIVRWPGRAGAGTTCDRLFSLIDIPRTVWDAAGVIPAHDTALDSISQLSVWLDPDAAPVRTEKMFLGIYGYALRSGDWVYIPRQGSLGVTTDFNMPGWLRLPEIGMTNSDIDETGHVKADAPDAQLYNLKTDPSQTRNVIEAYPEKAAELAARFKVLHKKMTDEYERNLK
jgi:arylsulfatase A